MPIAPAQRTMNWREAQIAKYGRKQFNKIEYAKRKAREQSRAQARALAEEKKEEPVILRKPPELPPKKSKFDLMVNKTYNIKRKYLQTLTPPRTIKKDTARQHLKRVINIYERLYKKPFDYDLDFLNDKKAIVNFIEKSYNTQSSRKSQLVSILAVLFGVPKYEELHGHYLKLTQVKSDLIERERGENKLNSKEQKNIIAWEIISNSYKKADNLKDKALMAVYTLLPPRRADYSIMKLGEDSDNNFNYLSNGKFIFNNYKTSKTYGKQVIRIPNKLSKILTAYIETYNIKKGDYLFGTREKKLYKNFSPIVSRTFRKYTGKSLNINLLRHLFITDYLKKKRTVNQKKNIAMIMAHSLEEQQKYFKF
jgi:hypothetical protein